jgi:hypothetical protein
MLTLIFAKKAIISACKDKVGVEEASNITQSHLYGLETPNYVNRWN